MGILGHLTAEDDRRTLLPVAVGDYLHSERDLYRIEQLGDERALIEDCLTGDLIDAPLPELARLERLHRD